MKARVDHRRCPNARPARTFTRHKLALVKAFRFSIATPSRAQSTATRPKVLFSDLAGDLLGCRSAWNRRAGIRCRVRFDSPFPSGSGRDPLPTICLEGRTICYEITIYYYLKVLPNSQKSPHRIPALPSRWSHFGLPPGFTHKLQRWTARAAQKWFSSFAPRFHALSHDEAPAEVVLSHPAANDAY